MRLSIHHRTHYIYSGQSSSSHNEIRLKPVSNGVQTCLEYRVLVNPQTKVYEYETIGGVVNHFAVMDPHVELDIQTEALVDTFSRNPFESLDLLAEDLNAPSDSYLRTYAEFLSESPYVQLLPELRAISGEILADSSGNTAQYVLNVKEWIFREFAYEPYVTNVNTLLDEVLELRAGVCQDFSHVMIGLCRIAGIPTRYVSGYLYLGDHDELRGTQATHAWVEVLLPGGEWLGIDPTNDIVADERYVKVHVGRDYGDVTPVKGVYVGYGTQQMDISVGVQALSSA